MDKPTRRSSHARPIPRIGGIGPVLMGAMAGMFFVAQPTAAALVGMGIGVLIAVISFLDDIITLPSIPRLGVHLVAAS